MTSTSRKRYRRYLEPGDQTRVPRQTHSNRKRRKRHGDETGNEGDEQAAEYQSPTDHGTSKGESSQSSSDEATASSCSFDSRDKSDGYTSSSSQPVHREEAETEEHLPNVEDPELISFLQAFANETLPNLRTTKAQAFLLVLSFIVAAGLSWSQVDGLLNLINALFGCDVLPRTKFMLRKLWNLEKSKFLKFHYYCSTCTSHLGMGSFSTDKKTTFSCEICSKSYSVRQLTSKGSFYFIFNIRMQLQILLSDAGKELYINLRKLQTRVHDDYRDLTDGKLYREIRQTLSLLWSDITMSMNTDGALCFKSGKHSVWPIQLTVNELPVRTRWQHILVGGLWFAKMHPPLHLLIKSFVNEFNKVGEMQWTHDNKLVKSRFYVTFCFVDSPARALLLNMKQYNGYSSCLWCLEPGKNVEGVVKLPYAGNKPERTHQGVYNSMVKASRYHQVVDGINGLTPLIRLKGMNLVWGFSPDYMHAVLEGVTKQLVELWLTCKASKATKKPFYIGSRIRHLDARISKITPPIGFPRLPRPISERALWKASEWKFFLLLYALPSLSGILPERFLKHFSLLSQTVFLLLKTSVSKQDVTKCSKMITQFVRNCVPLYGAPAATYNMHLLLHLPKSVEMLGPLWSSSTFPFESKNGSVLKLITAARYVPHQIGERCLMSAILGTLRQKILLPPPLKAAYQKILHIQNSTAQTAPLGIPRDETIPHHCSEMIQTKLGFAPQVSSYERAEVNGIVFHRSSYTNAERTCSCYVKMKDETYCKIEKILLVAETQDLIFISSELITTAVGLGSADYIVQFNHPPDLVNLVIHFASDVLCQCVLIEQDRKRFLADVPNAYEMH